MQFQLKKVRENAILPAYGSSSAAGLDLSACIDQRITINPGDKAVLVPTGVAIYMRDPNVAAIILPRSGLGHKRGLVLGNGSGVIDADYQGELFVSVCVRPGHSSVSINPGDRIAQLVITPIIRAEFEVVELFDGETARGDGGFGSTGTGVEAAPVAEAPAPTPAPVVEAPAVEVVEVVETPVAEETPATDTTDAGSDQSGN